MTHYIANADLMREIETSVLTWCSEHKPADGVFHGAVADEWNPTDEELNLAWQGFYDVEGREPKGLHEIVFRKPTWDHVPQTRACGPNRPRAYQPRVCGSPHSSISGIAAASPYASSNRTGWGRLAGAASARARTRRDR